MAVYHFTWHAHGTWRPDDSRGYVERGEGILPPDPERAMQRDDHATQPRIEFDEEMQKLLIAGAFDAYTRRAWRLHAVGTDPTHVHLVVSWTEFTEWFYVRDRLKNVLSLFLGRLKNHKGGNWFVGNGSRKHVEAREHYDHLINTYLPGHRGLFWREGLPLPEIDPSILNPSGAAAQGYDQNEGPSAQE